MNQRLVRQAKAALAFARREIGAVGALLSLAVLTQVFLHIAEEMQEGDTGAFDRGVLTALRVPGHPHDPIGPHWLVTMAMDITALGSLSVLGLIVLLVAGLFASLKRFRQAAVLLIAAGGGLALSGWLKDWFDRPRPAEVYRVVEAINPSFPSGHAIGGMGAITQAMAKAAREKGVDIRTDSPVREIIVEKGRAVGAVTEAGEAFRARTVVSNLHPKLLFEQLVDPAALPEDFKERIARYRSGSATFRMNVALSELPRFTCLPEAGDHLTAGIIMAPSLGYMETAFSDARATGWSKAPIVEMLIPSILDGGLAPQGRHVASLFCQHAAPVLPDGRSWDDHREEVADLMIETVEGFAPGFKASVLGHGHYRAPVGGLYLCGAGTHPGGGVTGAPGHNAAREILKDLRR